MELIRLIISVLLLIGILTKIVLDFKVKKRHVHHWVEINRSYYYDYNFYKVLKITYICPICNKKKIIKLY